MRHLRASVRALRFYTQPVSSDSKRGASPSALGAGQFVCHNFVLFVGLVVCCLVWLVFRPVLSLFVRLVVRPFVVSFFDWLCVSLFGRLFPRYSFVLWLVFLFIFSSVCLSVAVCAHLCFYRFVCLFSTVACLSGWSLLVCLSALPACLPYCCLSVRPSVRLIVRVFVYLFARVFVSPCVCLICRLLVRALRCLSISLADCIFELFLLFVCLNVCLFVWLVVCLALSLDPSR